MKNVFIAIFIFTTVFSFAKRRGPRSIPPVYFKGKKIVVRHWARSSRYNQNGGVIEIRQGRLNKLVRTVLVYKIHYKPNLERDVQDVFIKSMKLLRHPQVLLVVNEKGRKYIVNLRTYEVKRIR